MTIQPATAPLRCLRQIQLSSTRIPSLSLSLTLPSSSRSLSTTPPLSRQTPSHLTVPTAQVPTYPYGAFQTYKQRNAGLYGRSKIRFGNVVAAKYKNKSRTSWLPNRHTKRLWSPSLNAFIRTRMTASILHTIDRLGGIDEYLLGSKAKRIKELGPAGWALRWKIMQTPAVQARFARERAALGLPPKEGGGIDDGISGGDAEFPVELASEGLTPEAVDAMLERDEEFVIGEPIVAEEDVQGGDRDGVQQEQRPE